MVVKILCGAAEELLAPIGGRKGGGGVLGLLSLNLLKGSMGKM